MSALRLVPRATTIRRVITVILFLIGLCAIAHWLAFHRTQYWKWEIMSTTAETMTVVAADGSLGFHWHRFTIETLPDREHWFLDLQLPRRKHAEIRFLYETRSWGAPDESGYESDRYLFFYASAASLWIIVCVTWIYPAVRLYRNIISRWRQRSGHCRTCGYDLTGNVSGRCPECGEHIEAVK